MRDATGRMLVLAIVCAIQPLAALGDTPVTQTVEAVSAQETRPHADSKRSDDASPFRVYFEGNSLTAGAMRGFGLQSSDRDGPTTPLGGKEIVFGKHIGPGMSPRQLWHRPVFSKYPFGFAEEALTEYEWDAITLQPFGDPDAVEVEYCAKYVELALPKSPRIQSYVYGQWPRKRNGDFGAQWLARSTGEGRPDYSRDRYENITRQLRQALPAGVKPPRLIPVGHVLHRLNQKIRSGELTGYDSIYEFYRPDGLHLNINGSYVAALTFYACFFGESPLGLNVPEAGKGDVTYRPFTSTQLRIVQETVWEVVTGNPLTGIYADAPAEANTLLLQNAVVGEPYRDYLHASFGRPPYRWESVSGQLPSGLVLGDDGEISGTAESVGSFPFRVAVTDEQGGTDHQEVRITVEKDRSPRIISKDIPRLWQGEPFKFNLTAEGGNRGVVWENIGALPPGFVLEPGGRLHGAPALQGCFEFQTRVSDLDLTDPESDTRKYTVAVNPPQSEVVTGIPVKEGLRVDGKLDEPAWSSLRYAPEKSVEVEMDAEAAFDVAWKENRGFYIAISVKDDVLVVNESEPWLGDSVEIYLDVANNRQQVYNSDDYRIVIDPEGHMKVFGVDRRSFECAAARTAKGYDIEVYLGHGSYNHRGYYKVRKNAVFGFDVALNDVDAADEEPARAFWHGDESNETDPGNFGILIFTEETK